MLNQSRSERGHLTHDDARERCASAPSRRLRQCFERDIRQRFRRALPTVARHGGERPGDDECVHRIARRERHRSAQTARAERREKRRRELRVRRARLRDV